MVKEVRTWMESVVVVRSKEQQSKTVSRYTKVTTESNNRAVGKQ